MAASQVARSVGPWKSSRASARASSCSSGSAWIWAVVAASEGAAAAVEEAEGHCRFAFLAAFGFTFGQPVLNRPGMADIFSGDAGDQHDLLFGELREPMD